MNLEKLFQLSIYSLTAISGAMLAFGEETPYPCGLTVFLAVLAFFFNERFRLIRIPLWASNALGLAAAGMAVREFLEDRPDAHLLAGAHFLVYLTWIVLFQDKQTRQYWWFFALGLLQVAVGAVMTLSGWYGLFLVMYLILALWTMAVFHLHQRALAFGDSGRARAAAPADARRTLVEDSVQQDIPGHWVTWRFVLGVFFISIAGLSLGLAMFLVVPRLWLADSENALASDIRGNRSTTGFSTTVTLGHLGQILESNDKVFELRLFDDDSDAPVRLDEFLTRTGQLEPLFRGSVLDTYEGARWSARRPEGRTLRMRMRGPERDVVRQEYAIDPMGSRILFAMRPIRYGAVTIPNDVIDIDSETYVLSTHAEYQERVHYRINTQKLPPPPGPDEVADRNGRIPGRFRDLRPPDRRWELPYLQYPKGLERLRSVAIDWVAPSRLIGDERFSNVRRRALTIESRLRDSGEFSYTLDMAVEDPDRDPIEDFLFNRKKGHCEYYASALAMMLRAVDIPSRLVTGFKGADYSSENSCYEVRQRHAHAWVEAWIDDGDDHDEWLPLDATPGDRETSVRQFGSNGDFWRNAKNSLSSFWSTYVVSMSYNRQKESLYDPLAGSMSGGFESFTQFLQDVLTEAKEFQDDLIPRGRPTAIALMLMAGFVVIVLVAVQITRRGGNWLRARRLSGRGPSPWSLRWRGWLSRWAAPILGRRVVVEFYEQFLGLLRLRGLRPAGHQTPREFARQVEGALAGLLGRASLATLPHDVTDSFYRVRFGGDALSSAEIEQLGERIRLLEDALRQRRE